LPGAAARGDLYSATQARRRHVRLLVVARHRLAEFRATLLDEPELHRFVAVALRVLRLDDHARPGLDDGCGMNGPVRVEDLRHSDLFSDDARNHYLLCRGAPPPRPVAARSFARR